MYDRLLKLLEEEGKKKPQQPELIANRPGTMLGGAGSGKAPASTPFYPRYTASSLEDPQERSLLVMQLSLREMKDRVVRCQASLGLDDHR